MQSAAIQTNGMFERKEEERLALKQGSRKSQSLLEMGAHPPPDSQTNVESMEASTLGSTFGQEIFSLFLRKYQQSGKNIATKNRTYPGRIENV